MGLFNRLKGWLGGADGAAEPAAAAVAARPAPATPIAGWSGPDVDDLELAAVVVGLMEEVTAPGFGRLAYEASGFQERLGAVEQARAFNDVVEVLRRVNVALRDHWPAVVRLARLYTALYDNGSAEALYLRMAAAGQQVAEANYQLGVLAERQDRMAEAAAYYQRAVAEDVSYGNAWQRAEQLKVHLPMRAHKASVTVGGVATGAGPGIGIRPPEGFELRHPLGRGGFGTVYVARDTRLHREVAIKFLHPHLTRDGRRTEAFFEEARLVARLGLPGVVRIYDLDPEATLIVMEYLTRGTLRDRLASGRPLVPQAALRVAMALLKTLSRMHATGLVHRDIKPENILFRADGSTVLGDFGVAMLETGTLEARAAGTLAYMSPEQKRGAERLDRRVDLYAVGLVLVEMLAGVMPPDAGVGVYPPSHWIGLVPRRLRTVFAPVLGRLLAEEPADRVSDARKVYVELGGLREQLLARDQGPELLEELQRLAALGGGGPESEAFVAMVRRELGL